MKNIFCCFWLLFVFLLVILLLLVAIGVVAAAHDISVDEYMAALERREAGAWRALGFASADDDDDDDDDDDGNLVRKWCPQR